MLLGMCQGAEVPPMEDLKRLMYDLLYLRVAYVTGSHLPFPIRGTKFLIPAFLSQIIEALGKVESDEFGFILTPNYPVFLNDDGTRVEEKRSLEDVYQEASALSRKFRPFYEASGVEYATELPKPREGNVSLLTFDTASGAVRTESKKNEPIYAVMAAIIGIQQPTDAPVIMLRISYGTMAYFKALTYSVGDYERRNN